MMPESVCGAQSTEENYAYNIRMCIVYIIQTTAAVRIFASTRRQQLVLECLLLDFHKIVDEIQGTRVLKLLHTYEWTSNVQQRAPNLVIYNKGSKENIGATRMLVSGVQEKVRWGDFPLIEGGKENIKNDGDCKSCSKLPQFSENLSNWTFNMVFRLLMDKWGSNTSACIHTVPLCRCSYCSTTWPTCSKRSGRSSVNISKHNEPMAMGGRWERKLWW